MNIGFIGLGKLGLPVALAIEDKGHKIIGTDINDMTLRNIRFKTYVVISWVETISFRC